jgi:hypothetical protein
MKNQSDWLNRANYTAEERRNICAQIMLEAQYWDVSQYLKMMHDSTKRPWVGLTDEQIFACENSIPDEVVSDRDWCIHFARAIEAKLKEKM